jgi:uncharacterized protein (UPF0147 family)
VEFFFCKNKKKIPRGICHVAKCHQLTVDHMEHNPRGQCATCIKYTRLKHQPHVYYTWLTCSSVFCVTRSTLATCISWTRAKLYISQQPNLPRHTHVAIYTWLTVCHVYGPHTRGNLQVANCNFFCSDKMLNYF